MSKKGNGRTVEPNITAHRAAELLERQIERGSELLHVAFNHPAVGGWKSQTEEILNAAYGKPNGMPHDQTYNFSTTDSGLSHNLYDDADRLQQHHVQRTRRRLEMLRRIVENLRDFSEPEGAIPRPEVYAFHPSIAKVSGRLFEDGAYRNVVLDAFIAVIERVRNESGLDLDGDRLMNRAFGCDGDARPVFRFNGLRDDFEKSEQRGILYLFRGIVGIRTAKAHLATVSADKTRAYEYLCLASLLMRLLDTADKSPHVT